MTNLVSLSVNDELGRKQIMKAKIGSLVMNCEQTIKHQRDQET